MFKWNFSLVIDFFKNYTPTKIVYDCLRSWAFGGRVVLNLNTAVRGVNVPVPAVVSNSAAAKIHNALNKTHYLLIESPFQFHVADFQQFQKEFNFSKIFAASSAQLYRAHNRNGNSDQLPSLVVVGCWLKLLFVRLSSIFRWIN